MCHLDELCLYKFMFVCVFIGVCACVCVCQYNLQQGQTWSQSGNQCELFTCVKHNETLNTISSHIICPPFVESNCEPVSISVCDRRRCTDRAFEHGSKHLLCIFVSRTQFERLQMAVVKLVSMTTLIKCPILCSFIDYFLGNLSANSPEKFEKSVRLFFCLLHFSLLITHADAVKLERSKETKQHSRKCVNFF